MQAALDERRKIFVGFGILALLLLGVGQAISGAVGGDSDPDLITAVAWVVLALDIPVLSLVFFAPTRFQGAGTTEPQLAAVAKVTSLLGAAIAFSPIVVGLVMLVISGDPWRMYAFAVLSAVAGAIFWSRIGAVLRSLGATPPPSSPEAGA